MRTRPSVQALSSEHHLRGAMEVMDLLEQHVRAGPGMNLRRRRSLAGLYFLFAQRWVERGELRSALRAWEEARSRGLTPAGLHAAGQAFLALKRTGLPADRAINKWSGWARFRAEPELI